jgi:membrane-associated phospholipid phosphatase
MVPVGLMRRPSMSRPTGAAGLPRRLAIASLASLALVCFAAGRLLADELPGSPQIGTSSAVPDSSTERAATAPFVLDALRRPFWSGNPDLAPCFAMVDGAQAAPNSSGFGSNLAVAGSNSSSIWTAVGRWEARLWRPERPTIVLTSNETTFVGLDDEAPAPLMPPDPTGNSPDQSGVLPPTQVGSDLQPIDGCACPPIRFSDDAWAFLPRVARDTWGVVNNWDNLLILGTALGGSLALRGEVDQDVNNWTAEHPDRWGHATNLLGDFGTVQYQIPVIFGAYALTVWEQDDYEHQMMTSLISAYTVFGVSTLVIKVSADTKRPSNGWNGGNYGFPSWHDGSLFCMSAVIDEYEGHWIGVPLYVLSGLVGWSRIDARDHNLSDVVFGGVLGYVIGKSVAGRALYGDSRAVHILPYVHPSEGTAGVMFDAKF